MILPIFHEAQNMTYKLCIVQRIKNKNHNTAFVLSGTIFVEINIVAAILIN